MTCKCVGSLGSNSREGGDDFSIPILDLPLNTQIVEVLQMKLVHTVSANAGGGLAAFQNAVHLMILSDRYMCLRGTYPGCAEAGPEWVCELALTQKLMHEVALRTRDLLPGPRRSAGHQTTACDSYRSPAISRPQTETLRVSDRQSSVKVLRAVA